MNAIELEGVNKTFKRHKVEVKALKDISLTIMRGEAFGFVGPNGAGKSTAIKVILNIINDYQGEVKIFGHPARNAQARRRVGYVPESPALYEQLSPLEILRAGLSLHGIKRADTDKWCMDWLERFSIAHVAKRRLRELSKGTVQRVALAHAMAIQPELLILDEPLSGLDPVGRHDVVDILAEYKSNGGTIFLTSHVLHDVERLADRFGLIHQGELKMLKSPRELAEDVQQVSVRSLGTQPVTTLRCEAGNRWSGEVSAPQLWQVLHELEKAGHMLLEVKPSLSLEQVFMRVIGLK